jgi:hypothetical protein
MKDFFEKLVQYLEQTPKDQILKDWEDTKEFDEIGPTVEEFLANTNLYQQIFSELPKTENITSDEFSPKFSSGFFLAKN